MQQEDRLEQVIDPPFLEQAQVQKQDHSGLAALLALPEAEQTGVGGGPSLPGIQEAVGVEKGAVELAEAEE